MARMPSSGFDDVARTRDDEAVLAGPRRNAGASRRRSTRSLRQSLASSTAARERLLGIALELLLELLEQG
jgi:hypothetical protein